MKTKHAATIRKAIRHAKANHSAANLTAALARAMQWPGEMAYSAAAQALACPPEHAKDDLYKRAYYKTLHKQPRITVHHPGCKCGHQAES